MQRAIHQEIIRLIDARIPFAVATVISSGGSVPGKVGFKMIVTPDGRQMGTIGGAGLEEKVKKLALECIRTGRSGMHRFDLTYRKPGGLDSVCGGTVEVYVEAMNPKPHVLLCGGGHVNYEVARLCDQLEYFYSVLDNRPEYAAAERFPRARAHYGCAPDEFKKRARLDDFTHIVICGYSHRVDEELLFLVLPHFQGYVGMIGSATKRKDVTDRLLARGVSREAVDRIECPIGISIGAETPSEIAVSILTSIIRTQKQNSFPARKD